MPCESAAAKRGGGRDRTAPARSHEHRNPSGASTAPNSWGSAPHRAQSPLSMRERPETEAVLCKGHSQGIRRPGCPGRTSFLEKMSRCRNAASIQFAIDTCSGEWRKPLAAAGADASATHTAAARTADRRSPQYRLQMGAWTAGGSCLVSRPPLAVGPSPHRVRSRCSGASNQARRCDRRAWVSAVIQPAGPSRRARDGQRATSAATSLTSSIEPTSDGEHFQFSSCARTKSIQAPRARVSRSS
jgi:hypothetical protein